MSYYGGQQPPPFFNYGSAQGPPPPAHHDYPSHMYPSGPHPPDMYGQHGPTPGMFHGGPGPGHNGGMQEYGQEYYDQSQYPPHEYSEPNANGYHHSHSEQGMEFMGPAPGQPPIDPGFQPRPHLNPKFIPPENSGATKREEPTKILRNPYPSTSKDEIRGQQKDEIYDPSYPTLSAPAPTTTTHNTAEQRNDYNNSNMNFHGHQPSVPPPQNQNFHQNQHFSPVPQHQPPMHAQQQQLKNQHHQPSMHAQQQQLKNQHHQPPMYAQQQLKNYQQQPPKHAQLQQLKNQHQQPPMHAPALNTQHQPSQMHAPPLNSQHQPLQMHATLLNSQHQPPPMYAPPLNQNQAHTHVPPVNQHQHRPMAHAPPPPIISQTVTQSTSSANPSHAFLTQYQNHEKVSESKVQVMTGVVTQVQPGAFGMISEEIFFQESCVNGPLPQLGDKVVVEAEPVAGMPFKFNAKKVTRLDIDLVREEKNTPTPPVNTANWIPNHREDFERSNLAPLPTMPESLNLPKYMPPSLSSVIPAASPPPLKSILKRRGSPNLKRNPPPPPVISKTGSHALDELKMSSGPSSFKSSVFSVDLNREIPIVHRPDGPAIEFPEYTYVRDGVSLPLAIQPQIRPSDRSSPRITRLLPSSPVVEFNRSQTAYPGGSQIRSGTEELNILYGTRGKSRSVSPRRVPPKRTSLSPTRGRSRRSRSRSRSKSPRARRRSRSRSRTPKIRYSRSPSPRGSRRERSLTPRSRRRSLTPRSRERSRSVTPTRSRRRTSRSTSRDRRRSTSRSRRTYRSHRSSRSKSTSPHMRRSSRSSSIQSIPASFQSRNRSEEVVTHGIVVTKNVASTLFPKIVDQGDSAVVTNFYTNATSGFAIPNKTTPVPIKFQIANAPKATMVPNPSFKANTFAMAAGASTLLKNPAFNITKTVPNPSVNAFATLLSKGNKKKLKEQEPAFKVIDPEPAKPPERPIEEKIKQWQVEFKALKTQVLSELQSETLLKNPTNVVQLKQTIQNELQELRAKGKSDAGKKLLEDPQSIEQLKQTVVKDLQELREKGSTQNTSDQQKVLPSPNIQQLKESVQQGLKDLRSKFDSKNSKNASKSLPTAPTQNTFSGSSSTSKPAPGSTTVVQNKVLAASASSKNIPTRTTEVRNPPLSKSTPTPHQPIMEPFNPELEKLQEEIHRQRFMDEENRLKETNDMAGLQQLHYMEDRRRRRLEERHLSRIRTQEIQLKKDKNFGELARLREEWGPPAVRLEAEQQLRQIRMDEERQEAQLAGQAEAIRRQEDDYQIWLENEALSRSRTERMNRGFEGRVKRRRTPSPPSNSQQHQPPPHQQHHRRRRSRSSSYERYRNEWRQRSHRSRSHEMDYEQFVMARERGMPMEHGMPHHSHGPPPEAYYHQRHQHPDPEYGEQRPPEHSERFMISRAMDDVSRREDEIMQREMEIQRRMEVAERRFGDHREDPHDHHERHRSRDGGDYGRYMVVRRH